MPRPDKYARRSAWHAVARVVFPHVRRDMLEDVVARAWGEWLCRKDATHRGSWKVARWRIVDAARIEWGHARENFPALARETAELTRDIEPVQGDVEHDRTEELMLDLRALGLAKTTRAVALLLVRGLNQVEIASHLRISKTSAHAHVERLRERLAPLAMRQGPLPPTP